MGFFKSFIKELLDEGHTVDIATNEEEERVQDYYRDWGCKIYPLSCSRNPLKKGNIDAIQQIKTLVGKGQYDIVHCHTPIAATCTRLACRKAREKGIKVIYTSHGFHFYEGAPWKNWLLFFPIEWVCAYWTDVLITINKEDYALAQKKMHAKRVEYMPGVGITVEKFVNTVVNKIEKRTEIGVPENAFLLLSVGELNTNKNHEIVIRAISELNDKSVHYAIAGEGELEEHLRRLVKELGLEGQSHLLGYRNDVAELYKVADGFVLPSYREGLSVSLMESLASGLPVICSNIRGNTDMVEDGVTGYWANPFEARTFAESICKLKNSNTFYETCIKAGQKFDAKSINQKMHVIYASIIK